MRLAFSTLGCPAWSLDQIIAAATESGYEGVEWRGYQDEMELPRASIFTGAERSETRRRFQEAGLQFIGLGSSVRLSDLSPEARRKEREALTAYVDLAAALECRMVRVFGGNLPPETSREQLVPRMAEFLRELADLAASRDVVLVLETHDAFSTGAQVSELLQATGHPAAKALWDLHHPYREGEPPEKTIQLLASNLYHTHVKDSKDGCYCLLGEGDVPVAQMLALLCRHGYDGWMSVEWEKRWHPEIAEPEVVLPQYARRLRELLSAGSG
jgi:sugar phosphate isomerase/epimerase